MERRIAVLLVEDHPAVRRALLEWLQSELPVCDILAASSGEEALQTLRGTQPDLILMDISLPGITGIETVERIHLEYPEISIVMLTINDSEEYQMQARSAGANAFVSKARVQHDLLPAVHHCLEQRGFSHPSIQLS